MGRKSHLEHLKEFKRNLKTKVHVDKMLLFGSRAHGRPSRHSDFDLVVVSKDFKGKGPLSRSRNFRSLWHLNYPVDFLCYTPREFRKIQKEKTLLYNQLKRGIKI